MLSRRRASLGMTGPEGIHNAGGGDGTGRTTTEELLGKPQQNLAGDLVEDGL